MKTKSAEALADKIKDASNTNTIFDTRKYVLYDDAVNALNEHAEQFKPKWVDKDLLRAAFEAGADHQMKPFTTDLCGVDCPDFETWFTPITQRK